MWDVKPVRCKTGGVMLRPTLDGRENAIKHNNIKCYLLVDNVLC